MDDQRINELTEKIDWLILHLRYTQACVEILIENVPDTDKKKLIDLVRARFPEIS